MEVWTIPHAFRVDAFAGEVSPRGGRDCLAFVAPDGRGGFEGIIRFGPVEVHVCTDLDDSTRDGAIDSAQALLRLLADNLETWR